MEQEFHQIRSLPPYVFAEVNEMKAKAKAEGRDVIDFGMGNPDQPTPQHIVDKLCEAANNPKMHGYSTSIGIPELRKALSSYYGRRFNVDLDPETEVVSSIGSKEGLASLAKAITSPGDTILVPNPSYPIHLFGFIIAGGFLKPMPIKPDENLIKAIDHAARYSVPKPTAVVISYPSNPTALMADLSFYEEVVKVCKKHDIYILSDIAYAELYFDGNKPPSMLQVKGAKDITVEFYSLSKTYNMPGWRIGFAAGNKKLIAALTRVKSYLDYGSFTPIQLAATEALNGPQDCVEEIRTMYQGRRDVLISSFAKAGWNIPKPPATMFAWSALPEQFKHLSSMEFTKLLLNETGIAVSPGDGFGEFGEGFVRLAIVENEARIQQAAKELERFMANSSKILEDYERRKA
ncbi:MAG: LL-diaminopimelate aminotransferase [Alphaproteobacteria bacterium]|nr:LL-diaminopimelate aminotransferase [Alphaproteobacteria bacterium]